MANVFGRLLSDPPMKPLEVQLTTSTSVETRLSLDGTTSLQNQTYDPKKVMAIKIPGSLGNLVLPFNQALYGNPLAFVADMTLPNELSTSAHKSLALQFSYTEAKPIAAGTVFVLGDSLKLEAETATDPKSSTYTMNLLLPTEACVIDLDPFYGTFTGSAYFNRNVGTDPSKNSLGLKPTNDAFNPTWYSNMPPVPFENVAQVAYFRGGIKMDGQNRIVAELLVTGTNSTTPYQRRYNITRFVDEQNTVRMPYNPSLKYTLFINSSNENVFFAGVHEVKQIPNNGLLMTTYTQIYRPVIRVCGSTISSAYTGVISPITTLQVLSSSERNIVLSDFGQKNIQASNSKNVKFEGLYAKAANGATMDVVNTIERLDSKVFATEQYVNLLSCIPTENSWLVTTDNASGDLQCFVSPSYTLASIDVFTKDSPSFNNNINIQTSQDWNNGDGWRVVSSSTFQNNPLFAANSAFDKRVDTWWGSSEATYSSSGVGAQHLTLEYPTAVRLSSIRFAGSTRYPGVTAATHWTIQASNDTNFVNIESFVKTNWVSNQPAGSDAVIMGNADGRIINMIGSPMAWDYTIMLTKNGRIVNTGQYSNSADLARASYLPLNEAEKFLGTLGYTLDRQLSREDTMVVVDNRGQPTVIHRGSVSARDWLVDDVLIAAGSNLETQRLRRARQVTMAAEAKYRTKSNAVGHSLGGRLAELAGSGGEIVTYNRAAGLGDTGFGPNQPSRNGSR
ncbi:hypothetical protein T492DRAFT_846271 [Pavlovales sp. CCMP2436]|nr:hypothetical protein T492DRAFT_846271 [Pavlovales sp. CCMP2436]